MTQTQPDLGDPANYVEMDNLRNEATRYRNAQTALRKSRQHLREETRELVLLVVPGMSHYNTVTGRSDDGWSGYEVVPQFVDSRLSGIEVRVTYDNEHAPSFTRTVLIPFRWEF